MKYFFLFYFSDGSIPFLFGKKNILHFQVPFNNVRGKSLLNSLKFKKIEKVVCNSLFTKKVIDQEYGINSDVWYPPVGVEEIEPTSEKENFILAVGRFEKSQTEKRQDVLIETFKKMINEYNIDIFNIVDECFPFSFSAAKPATSASGGLISEQRLTIFDFRFLRHFYIISKSVFFGKKKWLVLM